MPKDAKSDDEKAIYEALRTHKAFLKLRGAADIKMVADLLTKEIARQKIKIAEQKPKATRRTNANWQSRA